MQKKHKIMQVEITSLNKVGNGLAAVEREENTPLFVEVPFTLPGDTVFTRIIKKKRNLSRGYLEEIVKPSEDRISPKCVHFTSCGGCRWQHIAYEQQLQFKQSFIQKAFEKLIEPSVKVGTIIPAENPWYYRNKMEYSFSKDHFGKKYLGLVKDATKGKVFNLLECHLTQSWFLDALKNVKIWWDETGLEAYKPYANTGALRNLTVREGFRTGDRMVILTVSSNPEYAPTQVQLERFIQLVREAVEPKNPNQKLSIFLRIQQVGKGIPTSMYDMLLYGPDHIRETLEIQFSPNSPKENLHCSISPSAFFQPNPAQAEKVYSLAISLAKINSESIVYDLYCGTGILGLCAAKLAKQVIGIELMPESVLDARVNAEKNNCTNITFISGAVRHVLGQVFDNTLPKPDVVMIDPPRAGIDPQALSHILKLRPNKILYVSCNPLTQAANVAQLKEFGYRLDLIQPIDLFPQTYHIENIVVLTLEPLLKN